MDDTCVRSCKKSGVCFRDSDCCSGYYCNPYGACASIPSCVFENGDCTKNSCCSGLTCNNGLCTKHCKQSGPCSRNADCCEEYLCNQNMQCASELPLIEQSCEDTYPNCVGICYEGGWCFEAQNICVCSDIDEAYCLNICNQHQYTQERIVHSALDCFSSETYIRGCCCS
ncbi:hypothetical protein H0N99_00295 [Candidatus Micrarchaeota archaeon]|nr:hypothetical protein [Candidatus Micrarchaeota archaeon]